MSVAATVDISRALAIGGWMSERELLWLATQAQNRKLIVEFGSLHGRSSRALADNTRGKIWCVDPWSGDYISDDGGKLVLNTAVYPYFCRNLEDHIKTGRVVPVRGFSYSFKLSHQVDMVFIDGDHRYETVVKDIKKAYELLGKNGLICGHDYNHPEWPGVHRAVVELVYSFGVEDSIWWAIV